MTASIFTIERRKNFTEAFLNFFIDLQTEVITTNGDRYKMFDYLNRCVRYWPHRCGATGIDDYLKGIGVDITAWKSNQDMLFAFELLINLLYWAPEQDLIDDKDSRWSLPLKMNNVQNESNRLIDNATYILEQCCNMAIRKLEHKDFPEYRITKRNFRIDSSLVAAPQLSEVLLGYYDIRNENNIDYKKSALTTIYNYLEPKRIEYRGTNCSAISEEFFTGMNSFGIRHNTKTQVRLNAKNKMAVCDKLFMMAVYILQSNEVNMYKSDLKVLREK